MATFNGARFVERQVATILEQLEPGDELVISDDGSTDETVALVRRFADPRIRILDGNAFRSPLRNFEHAVRHAEGETIVLADQDDVWLPNKLPLVRELFAGESARPYLVVLDARIVDEDERVVYPSVHAKLHAGPGFVKNIWANRYLGCCTAYIALLRLLGTLGLTELQPLLDVPVRDRAGRTGALRAARLPPPAHLGPSFLAYPHLSAGEKAAAGLVDGRIRLRQGQ